MRQTARAAAVIALALLGALPDSWGQPPRGPGLVSPEVHPDGKVTFKDHAIGSGSVSLFGFDLTGRTPNIPDAHAYLNLLIESQLFGGETLSRLRSTFASATLDRAVRLPQGKARDRAYAEVDATLAREYAPVAPLNVVNEATLVSDRVGCIVLRPVLDLAVACLKE